MRQTDKEADEAVAHIRQSTADPIRRFLDSVVSSRLEEETYLQDREREDPPKLDPLRVIKGAWARTVHHLFDRGH